MICRREAPGRAWRHPIAGAGPQGAKGLVVVVVLVLEVVVVAVVLVVVLDVVAVVLVVLAVDVVVVVVGAVVDVVVRGPGADHVENCSQLSARSSEERETRATVHVI